MNIDFIFCMQSKPCVNFIMWKLTYVPLLLNSNIFLRHINTYYYFFNFKSHLLVTVLCMNICTLHMSSIKVLVSKNYKHLYLFRSFVVKCLVFSKKCQFIRFLFWDFRFLFFVNYAINFSHISLNSIKHFVASH